MYLDQFNRPLIAGQAQYQNRQVQDPELVQNQLKGLLNSDSPYIRNARDRGTAFAASRGLMNSAGAAGSAEGAAIDAAMPIAAQDAQTYFQTSAQNMDAANQALANKLQSDTSIVNTNTGASASMRNADLNYQAQLKQLEQQRLQAQLDRDFQNQQAGQQHGWNMDTLNLQHGWEQDAYNQQNRDARNNYTYQTLLNSTFSDPSIWRDPQGAMGRAQYYGQNFNSLYDSIFGGGS